MADLYKAYKNKVTILQLPMTTFVRALSIELLKFSLVQKEKEGKKVYEWPELQEHI